MSSDPFRADLSLNVAICAPSPRSYLPDLPYELHQEIYKHIFTPWSLAILNPDDHHNFDETVQLQKVGNLMLSGPPGYGLLVACRHMYNIVKHRFGSKYTGIVHVGIMKRLAVVAEGLPRGLRRWYKKTSAMYSVCPQHEHDVTTYFTRVFRKALVFDFVVFNSSNGLYNHNVGSRQFVRGHDDGYYTIRTSGITNRFYARHPKFKWYNLQQDATPVANVILNFKMLVPRYRADGTIFYAALLIRCEGLNSTVVARMVRLTGEVYFWEEGMIPGTYQCIKLHRDEDFPEKMRWFEEVAYFSDYKPLPKCGCAQSLAVMLGK